MFKFCFQVNFAAGGSQFHCHFDGLHNLRSSLHIAELCALASFRFSALMFRRGSDSLTQSRRYQVDLFTSFWLKVRNASPRDSGSPPDPPGVCRADVLAERGLRRSYGRSPNRIPCWLSLLDPQQGHLRGHLRIGISNTIGQPASLP